MFDARMFTGTEEHVLLPTVSRIPVESLLISHGSALITSTGGVGIN